METLSKVVAGINRVVIGCTVGLAAGAMVEFVADIVLNGTAGFIIPGMGVVIGAIVGGVAGASSLAIDAFKRNKSQDSDPAT